MTKYKLTTKEQRIDDLFEAPMIAVTFLLVFTLAIPWLVDLPEVWVRVLTSINFFIWFTFYIELFVKFVTAENKIGVLKFNWTLVVITAAPLFIPLRLVRISRLLVLVRLLRLQKGVNRLRKKVRQFIYNVEYILIAFIAFIFSSAFIMWQVEKRFGGSIDSLTDALWWSAITVTTIGYGDIIPTSAEGKVVGAVVGVLGAILFMVFVARVTSLFVHDKEIESLKRLVREGNKSKK